MDDSELEECSKKCGMEDVPNVSVIHVSPRWAEKYTTCGQLGVFKLLVSGQLSE